MATDDIIFHGGPILTLDPGDPFLESGSVRVGDGKITGVSTAGPTTTGFSGEVVDLKGRLLMPGLVNGHTHAAMTLFRGLADDLPLMDWLQQYIFPAEQNLSEEWVYWGTMLACWEMIAGGTTAFCDMYLFEDAAAKAVDACGMRAVLGEVLYDFPSPNYGSIDCGFSYTRKLIEKWRGHDRITIAVEPHAPYTCSPELLRKAADIAREYDVPLITHLAETKHETQEILERYGCRPVAHLDQLGILDQRLIADHVVDVTPEEIDRLAEAGVKAVHNPESNMKLASGVCPVPDLLRAGVTVGLGTDGSASNNDLDMFREMDSAAKLAKVTRLDPTALPAPTVLGLATGGSAQVLGLGECVGKIAVGRQADLIVVDFDAPHLTPVYDHVSHLVYCAKGGDVVDTIVGGRWLMRDRRMLTLDVEEVTRQVKQIARSIRLLV